jgi:hypothetical protein
MGRRSGWQVTYTLPPRQTLVQEFPIPFPLEPQCFAAWCVHEDMALTSPQLDARSVQASDDPAAGAKRQFEIIFSNKETEPGKVVVGLTTDNLVLGQVSRGAARWVGGFVLVVLGAVALGLALGRKGPAAEEVLRGLSGDEVLDRIADLDGRWERKEIREREYRRWRGALVALAAEELAEAPGPAAERSPEGRGGARLPVLPAAARGLIERIEAIDRAGAPDPRTIAERAHLLEALLKALPRADGAPREKSEG